MTEKVEGSPPQLSERDENTSSPELTEDLASFLELCESKYANRFTAQDDDYMVLFNKETSPPPIIPNWSQNRRAENRSRRFNNRNYDNRGWNRDRNSDSRRDNYHHQRNNYDSYNRNRQYNDHDRGYGSNDYKRQRRDY